MEKLVLKSERRESSEDLSSLRASKIIPAVVYGKTHEATSLKVDNSELLRVFRTVGTTEVFNLELDGKDVEVKIKEAQRHPVTGDFLHIDFYVA